MWSSATPRSQLGDRNSLHGALQHGACIHYRSTAVSEVGANKGIYKKKKTKQNQKKKQTAESSDSRCDVVIRNRRYDGGESPPPPPPPAWIHLSCVNKTGLYLLDSLSCGGCCLRDRPWCYVTAPTPIRATLYLPDRHRGSGNVQWSEVRGQRAEVRGQSGTATMVSKTRPPLPPLSSSAAGLLIWDGTSGGAPLPRNGGGGGEGLS